MKRLVMVCAAIFAATVSFAQEHDHAAHAAAAPAGAPLDEKTERLVRQSLSVCEGLKLTRQEFQQRMPQGMTATIIRAESPRHSCDGQFLAVTTTGGSFYLGMPWILDGVEGASLEEKIKNFAWTRMQDSFTAVVDRQRTRDGLYRVTLTQTTERGKVPLTGVVDPDGRFFFMGDFRPATADAPSARLKAFEPVLANAPSRGAEKPQVTIVEFSDFQCPSCKYSSGYADTILEKHGDSVRYIRYDLPLMSAHPWAFAASAAGRAIYRQKPAAFWEFKKQIYANQDRLSAFTIDDFTRGFAQDHELDLAKFDADVAAASIHEELLKGIGLAFTNEIRATPTFMVNGVFVDPGEGGKALEAYVAGLVKK